MLPLRRVRYPTAITVNISVKLFLLNRRLKSLQKSRKILEKQLKRLLKKLLHLKIS